MRRKYQEGRVRLRKIFRETDRDRSRDRQR